jgi:hypothetical protein
MVKLTQSRDKQSRALAFGVHVEQGRFRLRGESNRVAPQRETRDDPNRLTSVGATTPVAERPVYFQSQRVHPSQQALFDEMTTFPFGEHDDLLDAAAFGTAHLLGQREPRVFL